MCFGGVMGALQDEACTGYGGKDYQSIRNMGEWVFKDLTSFDVAMLG